MGRIYNQHSCIVTITSALTISTTQYSANDVIGGLLTFTKDIGHNWFSCKLTDVQVIDDDDEKAELTLYLFDQTPSTIANHAAFAPTVADLKKLRGVVTAAVANYTTVNSNAYANKTGLDIRIEPLSVGRTFYGYLVCTGTPTYTTTTDLTLRLTFEIS
jgi:hypothetical protein